MSIGTHDPWKSLTIGELIPALDSSPGSGSMLARAKDTIDENYLDLDNKIRTIQSHLFQLQNVLNLVDAAKRSVQDVIDAIGNTGAHATTLRGARSKSGFNSTFFNAMNSSDAPEINDSTYAGAVLLVVTAPTLADVEYKLQRLENVFLGLKRVHFPSSEEQVGSEGDK